MDVSVDPDIQTKWILRRYIDLPKFLDLLHSRTLYLPRADQFSDRFEGALTPAFRKAMDAGYKTGRTKFGADEFYRRGRVGNFVTCWTIGAKDNMALWQLYGGVKTCLVITTTVKRLIWVAQAWRKPALMHRVKYIDHLKNPDMIVGRFSDMLQYKHESYGYEKELRLIVPEQADGWEDNPRFLRLPISDLSKVVRSVVVAPEADESFFEAVRDLSQRYGLAAPIKRSKLAFMRV